MPKKEIPLIIPPAPIRPGSFGYDVYNMQMCIDKILKTKGKQTMHKHEPAHYGPMTEKRVREFQDKYGLFVNGEYTPLTRLRIKEVLDGTHN